MRKSIKYLLIIITIITVPVLFIYYNVGTVEKNFSVNKNNTDTCFVFDRYENKIQNWLNDDYNVYNKFYLQVNGLVEDTIYLSTRYVNHSEEMYMRKIFPGKIDTLFKGDMYKNSLIICVRSKPSVNQKIKINFQINK